MKALVTGASRGIGRVLVRELVASGHQVWGIARSGNVLEALTDELGHNFRFTIADLTTTEGITTVVAELDAAAFSPAKIFLVAGAYSTSDATFSSPEHQQWMMACNFTGPVALYEALLQRETKPKQVVVLSSVFALLSDSLNPSYAQAKCQLADYFIQDNQQQGIATRVIYLGPVNTAINQYANRRPNPMVVEPERVARYLVKVHEQKGVEHIYPFSTYVFYQIFSRLPQHLYSRLMNKLRR